ncbi:MAG TPA: hypothetical protein VH639_06265 [Bryobacteraceae bacterium]|jgi:hypothetical protein
MMRRIILILSFGATVAAQWLNYPAAGIPRLPDGKPNLSAPAPKGPDGKPDLYGLWEEEKVQGPYQIMPLLPSAIKPEDVILTPEGETWQRQHKEDHFLDAQCLPRNLVSRVRLEPFKILPLRGTVVILYELDTTYRQIFTDGRELPKDPNPAWWGYSVGKWDGDTLVVDTTGFNDAETILPNGRPHSDALHIIERFRRRDFGHLEIQFKIDDPKIYAKPWSFKEEAHLIPDTELLEYICNENEKDLRHIRVK